MAHLHRRRWMLSTLGMGAATVHIEDVNGKTVDLPVHRTSGNFFYDGLRGPLTFPYSATVRWMLSRPTWRSSTRRTRWAWRLRRCTCPRSPGSV